MRGEFTLLSIVRIKLYIFYSFFSQYSTIFDLLVMKIYYTQNSTPVGFWLEIKSYFNYYFLIKILLNLSFLIFYYI